MLSEDLDLAIKPTGAPNIRQKPPAEGDREWSLIICKKNAQRYEPGIE
jgi:hypothetical protein